MPAIHTAPVPLPADVVEYITDVFLAANGSVTSRLDRMPTTHEENLDFSFIDSLAVAIGPHRVPSGVVVDVDVHFLGGGRHWDRWEIADIGVIVNFRRQGALLRTKLLLFQSKRLYPQEADFIEFRGLTRPGGFGSLMEPHWLPSQETRSFEFTTECRYKALSVGDAQWLAIGEYEKQTLVPVHYLLYHPSRIPHSQTIPALLPIEAALPPFEVGARVLSASAMRTALSSSTKGYSPSFADLTGGSNPPGVQIHEFMRDEVLTCNQGYVAEQGLADDGLLNVFNRRSGPIAAAIRFDIDVPEDLQVDDLA